jgi:hypothetical protein
MGLTRLPAGRPGFVFRQVQETFLHNVQTSSGAHPAPVQWVPGSLSSAVKRQGRKTDYSPPSDAKVMNDGAIPPLPIRLYGLMLN